MELANSNGHESLMDSNQKINKISTLEWVHIKS